MKQSKKIENLLNTAIGLLDKIEERKALYEELDLVVQELREAGFESAAWNGLDVVLKDNFAESNVAFRPAAVRRYELTAKVPKKAKG